MVVWEKLMCGPHDPHVHLSDFETTLESFNPFNIFQPFPHFHDHATWPVEVATRWHVVYFESFLQLPHGDEN